MTNDFWRNLDNLIATSRLRIDRPKGSPHPRYSDCIYPFDYGYLENTQSGDGQGIDIWIGNLPERSVTAIICTLDLIKRDAEIKILLGCSLPEAHKILDIHRQGSQSAILVERESA